MRRLFISMIALLLLSMSPLATMIPGTNAQGTALGPQVGESVPLITIEGTEIGTITVNSIEEPFEAYDINSAPSRGNHYALVTVTIANTGARSLEADPSDFYMIDDQGFVSSYAYASRSPESLAAFPDLVYTESLTRDASITGSILFLVYNEAAIERIVFSPDSERSITAVDLRTTPVSVGTPVVFLGADEQEAAQITVNSVTDPFLGFDPSSPPAAGTRFIQMDITITNTGTYNFYADAYGVTLVDNEGFVVYSTFVYGIDPTIPDFSGGDLLPGASATGVLTYSMLEGIAPSKAIYNAGYLRQVIIADITADDLVAGAATTGAVDPAATRPALGPADVTPTTATTGATGDPAVCGPVVAWANMLLLEITSAVSGVSLDPETATPAELREGAAAIDSGRVAIEALDTPAEAVPLSEGFINLFTELSASLNDLADAREAGDTNAAGVALVEFNEGLAQFDDGSELDAINDELTVICPELDTL